MLYVPQTVLDGTQANIFAMGMVTRAAGSFYPMVLGTWQECFYITLYAAIVSPDLLHLRLFILFLEWRQPLKGRRRSRLFSLIPQVSHARCFRDISV